MWFMEEIGTVLGRKGKGRWLRGFMFPFVYGQPTKKDQRKCYQGKEELQLGFGADEWIVSSFGWMVESLESSICWLWYELLVVASDWPKKIGFRVFLMSFQRVCDLERVFLVFFCQFYLFFCILSPKHSLYLCVCITTYLQVKTILSSSLQLLCSQAI